MLVVQGTMNTRLSNALACRKDPREDAPHVLLIDTHDLENDTASLLTDFSPEALVGIPGVLMRTLPSITPETAAKVQRLHLTGELRRIPMYKHDSLPRESRVRISLQSSAFLAHIPVNTQR